MRKGFTLIEVMVATSVMIVGALIMAQVMTSQQSSQSQQRHIIAMRKILADETTRLLQTPDRYPVIPVEGTASVAGNILGTYPMRMTYVSCYNKDNVQVANRQGYVGYIAVRVDNLRATMSSSCIGGHPSGTGGSGGVGLGGGLSAALPDIPSLGGAASTCMLDSQVENIVRDSGQCDPTTALYEAQITPDSAESAKYHVLVKPLLTDAQIAKKGGLLRGYVKQSVIVSTGR